MRKLLNIQSGLLRLCLAMTLALAAMTAGGQTTYNISTTALNTPFQRWGVGNDRWNEQSVGSGQSVTGYFEPTVYYRRFTVPELVNAAGNYYWTRFDSKINAAIDARQKFAFGVFTMYAWPEADSFFNITPTVSGIDQRTGTNRTARTAVSNEWHTAMQAGATKDWIGESGDWVPNYNSAAFLTRLNNMWAAINNHLDTGGYTPSWSGGQRIKYRDVIQYIDIRGFGTWGEWHSYGSAPGNNVANYPPGTFPTVATFKAIIDAHVNNLQNYQLVCINNIYDGGRLGNIGIPAEVGVYALTRTTLKGYVGRRNDHAGEITGYDDYQLQLNPYSFGGYRMDTAHQYRHRLAPHHGEPPGGPVYYNGVVQGALPMQARKWKWASIGNGNYGQGNVPTGAGGDSVRLAYHLMGYHLRITGGTITVGSNITMNVQWQNFGLTPTYNRWYVEYSLRNGSGTTVWKDTSAFDPYLFSPEDGQQTKTDVFPISGVAAGTYGMYVTIKDSTGYMTPLQLAITGRDAANSYFLSNISVNGAPTNNRPIVSAGPNQTITSPDNDAALNSTVSDPDGTIASTVWTQTSGPNTATFSPNNTTADPTVTGLIVGVYVFNLLVTDDDGDTQTDDVIITVNAAPNLAPVAVAYVDYDTIQLAVDSVFLDATGSSDDVAVTGYLWEVISGPGTYTITSPTSSTTKLDDLVPGVYTIRLTVSDGSLTNSDDVTVVVLAAAPPPGERRRWVWSRKLTL